MFSTVLSTKLIGPLRIDSSDSHKANSQESNLLTRESFSSFPGGGVGDDTKRGAEEKVTPFQDPSSGSPTVQCNLCSMAEARGCLLPAGL